MSRTLLLHIGSHKTGTTSIQHWLQDNQKILAQNNYSFIYAPPHPDIHGYLIPIEDNKIIPHGLKFIGAKNFLKQVNKSKNSNIIASSENLSFFFQHSAIKDLRSELIHHFDEIRVIAYLRRQDLHAVSHYQEGSKIHRDFERQLFGKAPSALPKYREELDLYLDYNTRIGMWLDIFGRENVIVRSFQRDKLFKGDVILDFLDTCGIPTDNIILPKIKNPSSGFASTLVGHTLKLNMIPNDVQMVIYSDLQKYEEKLLPSSLEAKSFYANYRDSNQKLEATLGFPETDTLFSNDFSDYPTEETNYWTNHNVMDVVGVVASHIAKDSKVLSADRLRDAAVMAERNGNGQLALKLMLAAAEMRPNGPIIQKKLKELEALYGST